MEHGSARLNPCGVVLLPLLFLNPSIDIRRDLGAIRSVPLSCVAYGDNSNRAAIARSSI